MTRCINEYAAVKTENEYILVGQFDDGTQEVFYERRRIDDTHIEIVQHRNRDKFGNYYTTRKVVESDVVC